MEQKTQQPCLEDNTYRYKLIQLFSNHTITHLLPLTTIQIILDVWFYLQMLILTIDYFSPFWFGTPTAVFSYFNLSFYAHFGSQSAAQALLYLSLVYMTLYWSAHILISIKNIKLSIFALNIKQLIYLITKNVLFLPLLTSVLSLFAPFDNIYYAKIPNANFMLKFLSVLLLFPFIIMIVIQTFFNFEFLKVQGQKRKLKRSTYGSTGIILYMIAGHICFLIDQDRIYLTIVIIINFFLMMVYKFKDQNLTQFTKIMELAFILVSKVGASFTTMKVVLGHQITVELYFITVVLLIATVMMINTYSLEFQILNINKWPTADLKIRYNNSLRDYLSRKDQFMFCANIHGYMELHRHKCQNQGCPSRAKLEDCDQGLIECGVYKQSDENLLRCTNVVKRIYQDGKNETPVNSHLLLEDSIFLYEKGQKQIALKTLLQISPEELNSDKYYRYVILRNTVHHEMMEVPERQFLDLVSQLRIKHAEEVIIAKMEKAALTNLQLWTTLNQDHPDYVKLNEVAQRRIQLRQQVSEIYSRICNIAYNEKVTSLYVSYLEAIQNDQELYQSILQNLKNEYDLNNKITLQDWANSSHPVMVISQQPTNFGTIIDTNTSCALLFGYEKYELLNHKIDTLLPHELGEDIYTILNQPSEETCFMSHKSDYLLKIKLSCQKYNSMETGMATVIHMDTNLIQNCCHLVYGKTSQKILGITSSFVSFAGIQQKMFEDQLYFEDFFSHSISQIVELTKDHGKVSCLWKLQNLLHEKYQSQLIDKEKIFKIKAQEYQNCRTISFSYLNPQKSYDKLPIMMKPRSDFDFQFQIQATLTDFKYLGYHYNHDNYISQFSQLSFAETLKKGNTIINYAQGINTLRLKDNIIQVIEQNEQEDVDGIQRNNSLQGSLVEILPRKQEEQIYENRRSLTKFIEGYNSGYYILVIMVLVKILIVIGCIFNYNLMLSHHQIIQNDTSYIIYNNLVAGEVSKQLSLVNSIIQMQNSQYNQSFAAFTNIFKDNINYLTKIQSLGGPQYNVSVSLGISTISFLNTEFTMSLLDNAKLLLAKIEAASTQTQFIQSLQMQQTAALGYLKTNCLTVKDQMFLYTSNLETRLNFHKKEYQNSQILHLIIAIISIIILTAVKILFIRHNRLNKLEIFEIFLDITQIQIQQYTSKSQKFLTSLNTEDLNGEIDVDEQVQNTRKISNSTFTKKKRFKNIDMKYLIIFKFIIVAFLYLGYYAHSYIFNSSSLAFERESNKYYTHTSQGDYQFYSGLTQIQSAALNNQPMPFSLSKKYFEYYKDYFHLHYNTYTNVQPFHYAFSKVYMTDNCNGVSTDYGSTSIPQACQLPLLYPNGSYLIFTDMAIKTNFLIDHTSLTEQYYNSYYVLSKTHRMNSQNLIKAHSSLSVEYQSQMLIALILWIAILAVFGTYMVFFEVKRYIDRQNQSKNVLTILPISVLKTLPKMKNFCSIILKSKKFYGLC